MPIRPTRVLRLALLLSLAGAPLPAADDLAPGPSFGGLTGSCPVALPPPLTEALGGAVPPRYTAPGAPRDLAHEAYMDRLRDQGGAAGFAPLGVLDPSKPLVWIVPGHGRTFSDLAGLRELADEFSLLVVLYDAHEPMDRAAREVAAAMARLAPRLAQELGPGAREPLRMVGHSMGATLCPLIVDALREDEAWGRTLGPSGQLLLVDGPFRGVDVPWLLRLPGLNRVGGWVLRKNPIRRVDAGAQSLANASPSMQAIEAFEPPPELRIDFATVRGNPEGSSRFRHYAPVNSWFPEEIPDDEVLPLLEHLLTDGPDADLRVWTLPLWNRKVGLRHLMRALRWDADFPVRFTRLRAEMRDLVGPAGREDPGAAVRAHREALLELYDSALLDVVDAFEGRHTEFMWEDPRFLPWVRARLGRTSR